MKYRTEFVPGIGWQYIVMNDDGSVIDRYGKFATNGEADKAARFEGIPRNQAVTGKPVFDAWVGASLCYGSQYTWDSLADWEKERWHRFAQDLRQKGLVK
jgi:hypothetical protein